MTSCLFSLFFLFSSIAAIDPTGIKVRVTDRAQDVLKELGLVFLDELLNKVFPDFSVEKGFFKANAKRLTFTRMNVDPAQVSLHFQENSGLQFEIKNPDFAGKLEQDIILHIFKELTLDRRVITFRGSGVSVTIGLRLNRNKQGHLRAEIPEGNTSCQVQTDRLTVTSKGVLGSVWDLLMAVLQSFFNNKLCSAVGMYALPKLNSMLENITTTMELHRVLDLSIDYSLSSNVSVTSSSIDVPFKGLVWRGNTGNTGNTTSIMTGPDPVFSQNGSMAYIGISEFFFSSAAVSVFKLGAFQLSVPEGPVTLKLSEVPIVSINQSGISVVANITAQFITQQCQPAVVGICRIGLSINLKRNHVTIVSNGVQGDASLGVFVKSLSNTELNNKITDFLKSWFGEGVPLPLPGGVRFIQEQIFYYNDFVVVGGSLDIAHEVYQKGLNTLVGKRRRRDTMMNLQVQLDQSLS